MYSMRNSSVICVFTFVLLLLKCNCDELEETTNSLARGFGEHFNWKSYGEGIVEAKESGKPLMLIIHKSWCGACQALKPGFANSEEILAMSEHFIMVNTEDKEEPHESQFDVDGKYIPRIFFLDSNGVVQRSIYNTKGNAKYKYYYFDAKSIADSMKAFFENTSVEVPESVNVAEKMDRIEL